MKQKASSVAADRTTEVRRRASGDRVFRANLWITFLSLAGPVLGQPIIAEKPAGSSSVRVRVEYYNYAKVPNSVITEGFETTRRIFAQAGIRLLWKEVRLESTDDAKTDPGDDRMTNL